MELTLIVAATRNMGIGLNGKLPWTGLRQEMAYFARVTKRLPPNLPQTSVNAVVMGRKTWESIPTKFRPLKDRLNIVISRSFPSISLPSAAPESSSSTTIKTPSIHDAMRYLESHSKHIGRVFVIGGAQIYKAFLESYPQETKRVLLTSILSPKFDCDTAFPINLLSSSHGSEVFWEQKSKDELDQWVGEEVPSGIQVENETQYEFQMWEKNLHTTS